MHKNDWIGFADCGPDWNRFVALAEKMSIGTAVRIGYIDLGIPRVVGFVNGDLVMSEDMHEKAADFLVDPLVN